MSTEKILPTILMVIDLVAVIPYALQGNWQQAIYWLGCGVVTMAVTWL